MSLDNNHPKGMTIVEDLQIKEIHEISQKIDIVDQTVDQTLFLELWGIEFGFVFGQFRNNEARYHFSATNH